MLPYSSLGLSFCLALVVGLRVYRYCWHLFQQDFQHVFFLLDSSLSTSSPSPTIVSSDSYKFVPTRHLQALPPVVIFFITFQLLLIHCSSFTAGNSKLHNLFNLTTIIWPVLCRLSLIGVPSLIVGHLSGEFFPLL